MAPTRVEGVAGLHVDVGTALGGRDVVAPTVRPSLAYQGGDALGRTRAWKGRASAGRSKRTSPLSRSSSPRPMRRATCTTSRSSRGFH